MPQTVCQTLIFEYPDISASKSNFLRKLEFHMTVSSFVQSSWVWAEITVTLSTWKWSIWRSLLGEDPKLQSRERLKQRAVMTPNVPHFPVLSTSWFLFLHLVHALYLFNHWSCHTLPSIGQVCRPLTQSAYCPLNTRALPCKDFM